MDDGSILRIDPVHVGIVQQSLGLQHKGTNLKPRNSFMLRAKGGISNVWSYPVSPRFMHAFREVHRSLEARKPACLS